MKKITLSLVLLLVVLSLSACYPESTRGLGTPIPTFVYATPPQYAAVQPQALPEGVDACQVRAVALLEAWVAADAPESEPFSFTDLAGDSCQAGFESDILPLFTVSNIWYPGAPTCVACHNTELATAWAQLDVSSYAGILAGSRRASPEAKGQNILGQSEAGTDWTKAILYTQLTTARMPPGHPGLTHPQGPVISAGTK